MDQNNPNKKAGRTATVLVSPNIFPNSPIGIAEYSYDVDTVGPLHSHALETEVYYVLEGEGEVSIEDDIYTLIPGNFVYIEPGKWHQTKSGKETKLKFLGIFSPSISF